jgi:short subunit dehydrogenase-like uncharacterized protein
MTDRQYDVVLFGATGFTGQLTAEYLARKAGPETRGALAGRNLAKLEEVRRRLAEINIACAKLPLIEADVNDPASMRAMAASTKVVITTVGPYIQYGEPLVAACAAAGTDYVDLTGEPEFVDLMWLRYHEQAVESGARIIHCCGFDSIPHDLGVLYTVNQLPEDVSISVNGFVRVGGTFSGGTYHSAINAAAGLRNAARNASQRRKLESRPDSRRVHGSPGKPHRASAAGGWAVPFPTIDPQIVLRSARALPRYGPDFSYAHYLVVPNAPTVAALVGGAGIGIALAQFAPTRELLLKVKDPGEGPSQEQRDKSWFRVRFFAEAGGKQITTEVSGGDPGYGETAKMLGESALCLAHDELPVTAGQVTTAAAMGQRLIDRLTAAGITFTVV